MDCVDVDILVDAFRPDALRHELARSWLEAAARTDGIIVIPEVATSFLRIVSNGRIWDPPATSAQGLAFLDALCASPLVTIAEAPAPRWDRFRRLLALTDSRGNDLHDALLAAAAIELGARLVTFDRGFERFDGLRLHVLSSA